MKKVSIINIKTNQTYESQLEDPTEWINDCIINNYWGKPERWVRAKELMESGVPSELEHWVWHSEYYEESDILQTEERTDPLTNETATWVLLKAEYTVEVEDVTEQLARESRVTELKKLLADSDFRVTHDYYESLSTTEKQHWVSSRASWRNELRSLLQ